MARILTSPRPSSLIGHRGRNIANTASWALAAKLAAAANLFVAVPFVLSSLGPKEFGAWATLVSLVYFAGFLDFGFGSGTMNLVAAARGRGQSSEIPIILREGRRTLFKVAACLALTVLIALPLAPWHRLLGLPETMSTDCRFAFAAVLFSIVAAVPLNLANRVQLGLGHGARAFRWQTAGQLLALAVVMAASVLGATLPWLTLAAVGTPLLASIGNTFSLAHDPATQTSEIVPYQARIATQIRREGSLFFVMQLAAALAFSADLPLISALQDPTQAGVYAIVQRLFSVIPLALSLIWAPLWPAYRNALAAKDQHWVLKTLRNSLALAGIFSILFASVLVLGFKYILRFWMHHPIDVPSALLTGFALWSIFESVGSAIGTFLNAASVMRYQIIVGCTFAAVCFSAKIWALANIGVVAMPWTTLISYIGCSLLPLILFSRRILTDVLAKTY
ncbi:lipopolysaccharide biosynthesis protein [Solimonas terrae]|uniref:Oligosaccharide flippase family protein n=1 Tax=Solimonas terrae TaxID=1396819 RepID=A0A6M2BWJ6_9GAMM|nr:hypothetical protein [Solimonas terrae]NGY06966.1 hypothetical protein [Solimonas terrae]